MSSATSHCIVQHLLEIKRSQNDMIKDITMMKEALAKLTSSHTAVNVAEYYCQTEVDLKRIERDLSEIKSLPQSLVSKLCNKHLACIFGTLKDLCSDKYNVCVGILLP